eukprot:Filipodium_phascolosomae@DN2834_c0_g1_i1.p1
MQYQNRFAKCAPPFSCGPLVLVLCLLASPTPPSTRAFSDESSASDSGVISRKMVCSACVIIAGPLADDINYLLANGRYYQEAVIRLRLRLACEDPRLIQSGRRGRRGASSPETLRNNCWYLVKTMTEQMVMIIKRRWQAEAAEYEQDILPRSFCDAIGACEPGRPSLLDALTVAHKRSVGAAMTEETQSETHAGNHKNNQNKPSNRNASDWSNYDKSGGRGTSRSDTRATQQRGKDGFHYSESTNSSDTHTNYEFNIANSSDSDFAAKMKHEEL